MATGTCQYSYSPPHVPCPHPPLGSGRLCLFHYQYDKSADNFWKVIQEKLEKEDFDFEGYYFPTGPTADFRNRKFKDANFCNAIFKVAVVFYEAEFSGKTSFEGAEFPGRTDFAEAKFLGDTNFNIAKFLGNTDFRWVEFSGVTNFKVAKFLGERTNFEWAKFTGATYFVKVEFSGEVVFHSVWLGNCRFYDTELRRVKFVRCYFASQEGYRPIQWIRQGLRLGSHASPKTGRTSLLSRIDEKISSWTQRTNVLRDEIDADEKMGGVYELIARSYQQLKKYFQEEEKDYARAGEFFYGEMECRRKAGLYWPFLHLYWAFSGYGERYLRAFSWLLLYIFLLFPFLYYFTASTAYETKIDYDEFRECLLYSLNVITLRGTETSQSFSFRLCSTLEMIFGLIQSALFFMALRSKLRR